jgi:hypothetical protein
LGLAGYPAWDAHLVEVYYEAITALQHGLPTKPEIIAAITYQSVPGAQQKTWNAGHVEPTTHRNRPPSSFATLYANTVRAILTTPRTSGAGTLKDLIHHWEIWNEPNGATWTYMTGKPPKPTFAGNPIDHVPPKGSKLDADTPGAYYIYPSIYASVLLEAVKIIKDVQPDAVSLYGGVFCNSENHAAWPEHVKTTAEFLGGRLPCTAMGQHLYLAFQDSANTDSLRDRLQATIQQMKHLQAQYGGGTDIYITESGWESTVAADGDAGAACTDLFNVSKTDPAVKASCWFTLEDFPYDHGTKVNRKGIYDLAGTPKKHVVAAYQA